MLFTPDGATDGSEGVGEGRRGLGVVDTDGRALVLDPQTADVQDRDGAVPVLKQSRRSYPFIVKAFADAGYAGERIEFPSDRMSRERRIKAACSQIARLWGSVTPKPGDLDPDQ